MATATWSDSQLAAAQNTDGCHQEISGIAHEVTPTYPATKSAENYKTDVLPWMATGEKERKSTAVEGTADKH